MKFFHLALVCLVLNSCQGAHDDHKLQSGYPDTYPVTVDSLEHNAIRVERIRQKDNGLGLAIYYNGILCTGAKKAVPALLVKINFPDGSFVTDFIDAESSSGACTRFYLSNTCTKGMFDGCAQHASTSMQYLLNPFVAKEPGFSLSTLRPLDIEIAFVTAGGDWDSQSGANYHFNFPALPASY